MVGAAAYRSSEDRNKMMTKDVHFCMPRMASCKLPSGPRRARAGAMMDTLMARTTACTRCVNRSAVHARLRGRGGTVRRRVASPAGHSPLTT